MNKILKPVAILLIAFILFPACGKLPEDFELYCVTEFKVFRAYSGKWQTVYDGGETQLFKSLSYDTTNRVVAVSVEPRWRVKGSAKILFIDPDRRQIVREIRTGLDQILKMAFDKEGKRMAVIARGYDSHDIRTLYLLSLADETFQLVTEGDLFHLSRDWDNVIYLGYKKDGKHFVGNINVAMNNNTVNNIAEGYSISVSDIKDAFIYIDMKGNVIYNDMMNNIQKTLPMPPEFCDPLFLDSVSFVRGTDDLIVELYGLASSNTYLLTSPYEHPQKILNMPVLDYFAIRH